MGDSMIFRCTLLVAVHLILSEQVAENVLKVFANQVRPAWHATAALQPPCAQATEVAVNWRCMNPVRRSGKLMIFQRRSECSQDWWRCGVQLPIRDLL